MLSITEPKPNIPFLKKKKNLNKFHWKFNTIAKRYHLCLPTQMNLHPLAWAKQKRLIHFLLARSSLFLKTSSSSLNIAWDYFEYRQYFKFRKAPNDVINTHHQLKKKVQMEVTLPVLWLVYLGPTCLYASVKYYGEWKVLLAISDLNFRDR